MAQRSGNCMAWVMSPRISAQVSEQVWAIPCQEAPGPGLKCEPCFGMDLASSEQTLLKGLHIEIDLKFGPQNWSQGLCLVNASIRTSIYMYTVYQPIFGSLSSFNYFQIASIETYFHTVAWVRRSHCSHLHVAVASSRRWFDTAISSVSNLWQSVVSCNRYVVIVVDAARRPVDHKAGRRCGWQQKWWHFSSALRTCFGVRATSRFLHFPKPLWINSNTCWESNKMWGNQR